LLKSQNFFSGLEMQNKNIGSITIIYIQGDQTRNTILISLSLSINIIALLFIWQANQYKGKKEPQEIQKEKNSMEKEKKGKQKGMVILHAPLFSFSFFSSTSPCTGPRERDQIARPAGDGSNGRAAGRPRAKTRAVEMAAA